MKCTSLAICMIATLFSTSLMAQGVLTYNPGYVVMADNNINPDKRVKRNTKSVAEKAEEAKRLKLIQKQQEEKQQTKQKQITRLKMEYQRKMDHLEDEMNKRIQAIDNS